MFFGLTLTLVNQKELYPRKTATPRFVYSQQNKQY